MGNSSSKSKQSVCSVMDKKAEDYLILRSYLVSHIFKPENSLVSGRGVIETLELTVKFYLNKMELLLIEILLQGLVSSCTKDDIKWFVTDDGTPKGFKFLLGEAYFIYNVKEILGLFEIYELEEDYLSMESRRIFPALERVFLEENLVDSDSLGTNLEPNKEKGEGKDSKGKEHNSVLMSSNACLAMDHSNSTGLFFSKASSLESKFSKKRAFFEKFFSMGLFDIPKLLSNWKQVEGMFKDYINAVNDIRKYEEIVYGIYASYRYRYEREGLYRDGLEAKQKMLEDDLTKRTISSLQDVFIQLNSPAVLPERERLLLELCDEAEIEGNRELIDSLKKELREVRKKILGQLRNEQKETEVEVQEQLGWNCFDVAVNLVEKSSIQLQRRNAKDCSVLVRKAFVDYVLSNKANERYRQLLAPEIKHAAALTVSYMLLAKSSNEEEAKRAAELCELFQLREAIQALDEDNSYNRYLIDREIKQFLENKDKAEFPPGALPEKMRTQELEKLVIDYQNAHDVMKDVIITCNEMLSFAEGSRKNAQELEDLFANPSHHQDKHDVGIFEEVRRTYRESKENILKPHEAALNAFCNQEDVYENYVKGYYGIPKGEEQGGWFAFQREFDGERSTSMVDIASLYLEKRIMIKNPEGNMIYTTQAGDFAESIEIQYNGYNHFEAINAPKLNHQSFSKSSSASLASQLQRRYSFLTVSGASGISSSSDLQNQLVQACQNNDLAKVEALLQKGADPKIPNEKEQKPLVAAILSGNVELFRILEGNKRGKDGEQRDYSNKYIQICATEIVQMKEANEGEAFEMSDTMLNHLAMRGALEQVQVLREQQRTKENYAHRL